MVQDHLRGALPPRVYSRILGELNLLSFGLILLLLLFGVTSFKAPKSLKSSNAVTLLPVEWALSQSVSGVDCYHGFIDCNGTKAVVLKFDNKNKAAVKIRWKQAFKTKEINEKKSGATGEKSLMLPPGETFATACTDAKNIQCVVLPSEVSVAYGANITAFYFEDISITK